MNRSLFQVALERAATPASFGLLLAILALVDFTRDGSLAPTDGRDLEAARVAWIGLGAVATLLLAPTAGIWSRWKESDRHWLAPRPVHPARWFASSFVARIFAIALGVSLVAVVLGRHAPMKPAERRVAVLETPRERVDDSPRTITVEAPESSTLRLALLTIDGTGGVPTVAVQGAGLPLEFVVSGARTVIIPVASGTTELTFRRVAGSALVVGPTRPPELFTSNATRLGVLASFATTITLWLILPLGLVFALGRFLRPEIAFLAAVVLVLRFGFAPIATAKTAIHLVEWNAFDLALVLAELPRALTGILIALLAMLRTNGGTSS